ncbi:MAG: papain-like cysteine protease family protein [Eubacteriales bacterium]|nr:papain-like cysteine protease family protein [Eubacteriales bacterium]
MSEGAEKLGIDSTELPLDKQRVLRNLEVKNPVVCIMGPGDFTAKGHFIVMTGIEDGKIKINDPNSIKNSNKLWDFDDISSQINDLWAMRILK